MSASLPITPLKYDRSFEKFEPGEEETIQALIGTMQKINDTTSKNYGHAVRSSFAKSFALLHAELQVLPNLPSELAQGLFEKEARYPAIIRMSTAPGDVLPDDISTARGLAIKVMDVEGPRLQGSENDTTQDFIFVDAPFFFHGTLKGLLTSLMGFAATTDKLEGAKKAVSVLSRGLETTIEAMGMESSLIKHAGGQLPVHPLGDVYNTQAPVMYGPYMAKFRLVPYSPELKSLAGQKIELSSDRPDALREEVMGYFQTNRAEWELQVQLCNDPDKMPLEDPSVEWPEDLSPFIPVARLKAESQAAWSVERSKMIDDCMSFNPWHGLSAHRPLGAVMRARRQVYPVSSGFRGKFNGCPMHN